MTTRARQKQCSKCHEVLNYQDFAKDKTKKLGIRSACKKCCADQARESYCPTKRKIRYETGNKEAYLEKCAAYKEQNREYYRNYSRQHYLDNKGYYIEKRYKRLAYLKQRTPAWADLDAIRKFYNNCPKGYHVDHIIPLRGKIVSGLHVLENLQYLPAAENYKKGNKYVYNS